MLYTYCITFHVTPLEAYNTPFAIITQLLGIHGEFKKIESEEIERTKRQVR